MLDTLQRPYVVWYPLSHFAVQVTSRHRGVGVKCRRFFFFFFPVGVGIYIHPISILSVNYIL